LKEKFERYLKGGNGGSGSVWYNREIQSFKINECELFIKYKETTNNLRGQTYHKEVTIPIKNLEIYMGYFYLSINTIKMVETYSTHKEYQQDIGKPYYRNDTKNIVEIDFSREENIRERIQTALTHLATFCPEKKKETF